MKTLFTLLILSALTLTAQAADYSLVLVTNATSVTLRLSAPSNEVQNATAIITLASTNRWPTNVVASGWTGSHWTFEENTGNTAADQLADYDLTVTNGGWLDGAYFRTALGGDAVTVSSIPYNTNKLTVMCWVYVAVAPSDGGYGMLFSPSGGTGEYAHDWGMYFNTVGSTTYLAAYMRGSAVNLQRAEFWPAPALTTWVHMAAVLDVSTTNGDIRLWYNGTEQTEPTVAADTKDDAENFATHGIRLFVKEGGTYQQQMGIADLRILPGDQSSQISTIYGLAYHP